MDKKEYLKNPCRYSALPYYKEKRYQNSDIKVIHDDAFIEKEHIYSKHETYFRISRTLDNVEVIDDPEFEVVPCRLPEDLFFIVHIVNESYDSIRIDRKKVLDMMSDSVFEPSMWKFVINKKSKMKVGLGICHYDEDTKEVELDWIQITPFFRGIGLGKLLVNDLLKSAPKDAKFATVSGKVDNPSSPEKLYRSCGFEGTDIWHVLHK